MPAGLLYQALRKSGLLEGGPAGLLDATGNMAASVAADVPAGINSLLTLAATGDPDRAADEVARSRAALAYRPSAAGKKSLAGFGKKLSAASKRVANTRAGHAASQFLFDATAQNPALWAVATGAIDLLGGRGKRALSAAEKAAVEAAEQELRRAVSPAARAKSLLDQPGMREDVARISEQNKSQLVESDRLVGLPEYATIRGGEKIKVAPVPAARGAADAYQARTQLGYERPKDYVKVDPEHGKRIADAYDEMPHTPNDPAVRASYRAMIDETVDQWREIEKTGLKVEFIEPGMKDPYAASPRLGTEDVRKNNHLWVYPTEQGFGSSAADVSKNPLLELTDVEIGGRRLPANDVFRIVHDYFGHHKEGNGFRHDGEENAWRQHASMYSELARGAMTSETRGQNSWVNWGPHGAKNRAASAADTVYADQKTGLLPREFWSDEALGLKKKASARTHAGFVNPKLFAALAGGGLLTLGATKLKKKGDEKAAEINKKNTRRSRDLLEMEQ